MKLLSREGLCSAFGLPTSPHVEHSVASLLFGVVVFRDNMMLPICSTSNRSCLPLTGSIIRSFSLEPRQFKVSLVLVIVFPVFRLAPSMAGRLREVYLPSPGPAWAEPSDLPSSSNLSSVCSSGSSFFAIVRCSLYARHPTEVACLSQGPSFAVSVWSLASSRCPLFRL